MIEIAPSGSRNAISSVVIKPQAVYRSGKTFVVYQGNNFDPYAVVYDHSSEEWSAPVKVGTNSLTNDAHGIPCLWVDPLGYLHVWYGCHNSALLYSKSQNVLDISSWSAQSDVTSQATYPKIFEFSDGHIELWYRGGVGHPSPWGYSSSSTSGVSWDAFESVIDDPDDRHTFYIDMIQDGDNMHFGMCWKDDTDGRGAGGPEAMHRYNQYYLRRIDGSYESIRGSGLSTPITLSDLNDQCRVQQMPTVNDRTNLPSVAVNSSDIPALLYVFGEDADFVWRFAIWNGDGWDYHDLPASADFQLDTCILEFVQDSSWIAHVVSEGTSGIYGSYDVPLQRDRGGSIKQFRTNDDGQNWGLKFTLSSDILNGPKPVISGQPGLEYIASIWISGFNDFSGKIYSFAKNVEKSSYSFKVNSLLLVS